MRDPGGPLLRSPGGRRRISGRLPRDPPSSGRRPSSPVPGAAGSHGTSVAAAPEVPTVDEAGLPGFYASVWFGLWVPARTPQDIIARINAATVDALADAAVHQRIAVLGQQIVARDQQMPEALRAFQKAEIEKWWPIIKAANIKPE